MREHKEFDDYIKGLFDKDPEVPSELNWEAMDFDLPKTEVVEKDDKKEKKYRKYIGLLLLLLFTTVIGFLGINKYKSNTVQKTVLESSESRASELPSSGLASEESESVTNELTNNNPIGKPTGEDQSIESLAESLTEPLTNAEAKESQALPTNSESEELQGLRTQDKLTDNEPTKVQTTAVSNEQKEIASLLVENEIKDYQTSISSTKGEDSKEIVKQMVNKESIQTPKTFTKGLTEQLLEQNRSNNTDASTLPNSTQDKSSSIIETTEVINTRPVKSNGGNVKKDNVKENNAEEDREINSLSLLQSISVNSLSKPIINKEDLNILAPKTIKKEENSKTKSKAIELYVGYGYNVFNLNIPESNILQGKLSRGLGKSFTSGVRFDINDSWKVSAQVNYDQYHSTFEHIRDLDSAIDFTKFQRVHRQEKTFHNNYTNTLGLQLGLERRFSISKVLHLYPSIGIAPTYVISTKGKTTDGTETNTLTYNDQVNKLSASGGLNIRMVYSLNPSLNLEMAYQYKQFLSNGIFINNGVFAKQQNTLSLMVSYRLNK